MKFVLQWVRKISDVSLELIVELIFRIGVFSTKCYSFSKVIALGIFVIIGSVESLLLFRALCLFCQVLSYQFKINMFHF